jgi:hypothetical protein
MEGATSQSLFVSVEIAREEVPPETYAALPATVETRIAIARVLRCARETSHQTVVGSFERANHPGIPHS